MKKLIISLLTAGIALSAYPQIPQEADEYSIYALLLDKWHENDSNAVAVIRSNTGIILSPEALNYQLNMAKSRIPELSDETIGDFKGKNAQAYALDDFSALTKTKLVMLPQEWIDSIFMHKYGWEKFYKKFPFSKGILTFSRVGFDNGRNQALVHVASQWEHSTGTAIYVFLTNHKGIWVPKKTFRIWSSWTENELEPLWSNNKNNYDF